MAARVVGVTLLFYSDLALALLGAGSLAHRNGNNGVKPNIITFKVLHRNYMPILLRPMPPIRRICCMPHERWEKDTCVLSHIFHYLPNTTHIIIFTYKYNISVYKYYKRHVRSYLKILIALSHYFQLIGLYIGRDDLLKQLAKHHRKSLYGTDRHTLRQTDRK